MVEGLFTKRYLLCSNEKSSGYSYKHKSDAVNEKFIQFNANCLTTLSIDIDYCDEVELNKRLQLVPTPSMLVRTTKGYHLHYILTYPVSYKNRKRLKWSEDIKEYLTNLVGGDKHAKGNIRVFRNPLLHSTTYNDVKYTLEDFGVPYTPSSKKEHSKYSKKPTKFIDFTKVSEGGRNTSLFHYLRSKAYSLGNREDLNEILTFLANEANDKLDSPLSTPQVATIVKSITKFMVKYTGKLSSAQQTEFNRKIAKERHERLIKEVISNLRQHSFKLIAKGSTRGLAKLGNTSNATISRHKQILMETLRDIVLSNIALSYQEYISLNELSFEEILRDTKLFGGARVNDIPI